MINQNPVKLFPIATNILDISFSEDPCMFLLDQSSYIWACGANGSGQLGNGDIVNRSSFVPIFADSVFSRLIPNGTGALDASSYAWTWGSNNQGQMGINYSGIYWAAPRSVIGGKQWISLYGASSSGTSGIYVGLDSSSYAWAWGYNNVGQLGNNTINNASSPTSVIGGKQFNVISVAWASICGLDSSSYAWTWGSNGSGQIGDFTILSRSSPTSVVGGKQFVSVEIGGASCVTVALDSSSYAWMWGNNSGGFLGDNTLQSKSSPVSVLSTPWNKIFSSGGLIFGTKDDGIYMWGNFPYTYYYGNSSPNVLSPTKVNFPINVNKAIKKVTYCKNNLTNYAIFDNYLNVWIWGANSNGQLGDSTTTAKSWPIKLYFPQQAYSFYPIPKSFIKITETSSNNLILDSSSYAWAWGNTVVGIGSSSVSSSSPLSIIGNRQFISLSAVYGGAAALDSSSYAWYWGANTYGEAGNNTSGTTAYSPNSVVGGKQWLKFIAIAGQNSYGIDSSSYLWAWGRNDVGQLGNNSIVNSSSPVSVIGARQVLDIVTNINKGVVFLDNSSYIWSFGNNLSGQLGDSTITSRSSPVSVVGGRLFKKLNALYNSFFASDASSYLWAWGVNVNGQIGDNTVTPKSSPVSTIGGKQFLLKTYTIPDATAMVAVDSSSYAWAWGSNSLGILGDGSVANRSSPVSVIGGYQFSSIEMNNYGFVGVNQYPNSQYIVTGSQFYNRFIDYVSTSVSYSSPTIVNYRHNYLNSPTVINTPRKSIIGK